MLSSKLSVAAGLAIIGLFGSSFAQASAVIPGDLVVYQVGATGAATAPSSASTAVFLDEYSPLGVLVQQIAVPTAANGAQQALTNSGTATSEGALSLSADGQSIAFAGYNAAPGVASITGSTAAADPRGAGILNLSTGAVDTSTVFTGAFSANNIRSAVVAGSSAYAAGPAGVQLTTVGSTATPPRSSPVMPAT